MAVTKAVLGKVNPYLREAWRFAKSERGYGGVGGKRGIHGGDKGATVADLLYRRGEEKSDYELTEKLCREINKTKRKISHILNSMGIKPEEKTYDFLSLWTAVLEGGIVVGVFMEMLGELAKGIENQTRTRSFYSGYTLVIVGKKQEWKKLSSAGYRDIERLITITHVTEEKLGEVTLKREEETFYRKMTLAYINPAKKEIYLNCWELNPSS